LRALRLAILIEQMSLDGQVWQTTELAQLEKPMLPV
jgi:hypothetical protein